MTCLIFTVLLSAESCLKKLDLKTPTDAKKKVDSKEPPYVTSKEPPMLLRCALWNNYGLMCTMESAVSFKIDVNSLSYFNCIMGGGRKM